MTYGNLQIVWRAGGRALTNALGRFHPEIRAPRDRSPADAGCLELAVAGAPQLLFTNLAVASAMLNAFFALERARAPAYEEVFIDIAANRVVPVVRGVD